MGYITARSWAELREQTSVPNTRENQSSPKGSRVAITMYPHQHLFNAASEVSVELQRILYEDEESEKAVPGDPSPLDFEMFRNEHKVPLWHRDNHRFYNTGDNSFDIVRRRCCLIVINVRYLFNL